MRVDDTADRDFAVAFEFATRDPKFWLVVFPPEDSIAGPVSRQCVKAILTRNSRPSAVFDRMVMVSVRRTLS